MNPNLDLVFHLFNNRESSKLNETYLYLGPRAMLLLSKFLS